MTTTHPTDLAVLIAPHARYGIAGGYYRCECSHTYEAVIRAAEGCVDVEQQEIMRERHAQHIAEQLIAAGVELPAPDPRQALRDRVAARGNYRRLSDSPQA
jgi:hypothetical protein